MNGYIGNVKYKIFKYEPTRNKIPKELIIQNNFECAIKCKAK